jgi:hypothetical protein
MNGVGHCYHTKDMVYDVVMMVMRAGLCRTASDSLLRHR